MAKEKEKAKEEEDLRKSSLNKRRKTVMFGVNGTLPAGLGGTGPGKLLSFDKGETPILEK